MSQRNTLLNLIACGTYLRNKNGISAPFWEIYHLLIAQVYRNRNLELEQTWGQILQVQAWRKYGDVYFQTYPKDVNITWVAERYDLGIHPMLITAWKSPGLLTWHEPQFRELRISRAAEHLPPCDMLLKAIWAKVSQFFPFEKILHYQNGLEIQSHSMLQ